VFVTAYAQYAVQAFEHAAVDYLLKPVGEQRLLKAVERLRERLALIDGTHPANESAALGDEFQRLAQSLQPAAPEAPLTLITAAVGQVTHLIPVDDVVYFETAGKYLRVVTRQREALIRMTLRDLLMRLDPARFWQVHRSLVVQARDIAHAERGEEGRLTLRLHGLPDKLAVSRLFAHRFRPM
jgi:DNA-binding LytR/AlgR family response regulator